MDDQYEEDNIGYSVGSVSQSLPSYYVLYSWFPRAHCPPVMEMDYFVAVKDEDPFIVQKIELKCSTVVVVQKVKRRE